jgi:hypothetical protein
VHYTVKAYGQPTYPNFFSIFTVMVLPQPPTSLTSISMHIMDPDEPLFIAIGNIAVALKEYRETVISYNKACVEEIIEDGQRIFKRDEKAKVGINDSRWALDRRLDRIWRISLGMSGPVPTTIEEPRDFLTMIDFLPDGSLFTPHLQFGIVPEIQAECDRD